MRLNRDMSGHLLAPMLADGGALGAVAYHEAARPASEVSWGRAKIGRGSAEILDPGCE